MKLFKQQHWHLIVLVFLLYIIYWCTQKEPTIVLGSLWGISSKNWFILALVVPVLHQIYVLFCWRSELHYKSLTRLFGNQAFTIYKIGFALLFLLRPVTVILLSVSNENTLNVNTTIIYSLSFICLVLSGYLFYSVKRFFGINRAFGIDHFFPEKYKHVEMVRKGIFKFTSNGMYTFGFLVLYIPGLLFLSKAAILAALFNHLYIWAHFYFTELPDIKLIYKK